MRRHPMFFAATLALSTCGQPWASWATEPDAVPYDWGKGDVSAPADAAGDAIGLQVSPLVPGQSASFTVAGAAPGELVYIGRSTATGSGPCPPLLGGLCLDLDAPTTALLGTAIADATGTAVLTVTVPSIAPGGYQLVTQAAIARGVDSVKSAPQTNFIAPSDLPVGIPEPSFGWRTDTQVAGTLFVDNTHPNCDDNGPGSEGTPLCGLFRGSQSATFAAGTVVHVAGGPYAVSGNYNLTFEGTANDPVLILGQGASRVRFDGGGQRASFAYRGSYGLVENLDFYHKTRHLIAGDHLALRNVAVHNPDDAFIDFNPVVSVVGHDVLISGSEIFNNRQENEVDSHGIQASEGSYNVWILGNELHNNSGDSFQACHGCFSEPPHHIYIGRNVMHEDRENAIDLKAVHDVVISENLVYGYTVSATSVGEAIIVGSTGYDAGIGKGPRRIWILNNEIHDADYGVDILGADDVAVIGNLLHNLGVGVSLLFHEELWNVGNLVVAANTITDITTDAISIKDCQPDVIQVRNNLIGNIAERHIRAPSCSAAVFTIDNNLFDPAVSVLVDFVQYDTVEDLNAQSFATGNQGADPGFEFGFWMPDANSPAVDAGGDLSDLYDAFFAMHGGDIAWDRAWTPRPSGLAQDVGAYERPSLNAHENGPTLAH